MMNKLTEAAHRGAPAIPIYGDLALRRFKEESRYQYCESPRWKHWTRKMGIGVPPVGETAADEVDCCWPAST